MAEERAYTDYPNGCHELEYAQPITIGDNCWLCASVTVCGGVTIGAGSIIAAGAVVTRDIPPNSIAAGVPAKVLRQIGEGDRLHVWETYVKNGCPHLSGNIKRKGLRFSRDARKRSPSYVTGLSSPPISGRRRRSHGC